MAVDRSIRDHQAWLGYLQPEGLVVSPAALVDAQASLDIGQASVRQRKFSEFLENIPNPNPKEIEREPKVPAIASLANLLQGFFDWPEERLQGLTSDNPIPDELKLPLRDFGETLQPTYAFTAAKPDDPERPWTLLVKQLEAGKPLDVPVESKLSGWSASPTRRFERLLREADVPIGLLSNGTHLQLIYAPRGENAGTLTFPVAAMSEIPGRPILAALDMLLSRYRLLAAPTEARLPGLLKRSRDYQARVSTALAGQVLDALYELLRGFQAANDHTKGELLKDVLADDPDSIYGGLLTVLMRLVFLLYAEDQGLMPDSDLYARNYSVHGLFQRLRNDAEQYPDTMDNRYGAWAQVLALCRAIYGGSKHPLLKMPAREGHLFDPDRYPFLESRLPDEQNATNGALKLPLVSDGVIFRILDKLLVLDGERLSYRTLDVEQIGSVYETMMGFKLELAGGTTIALKPNKSHGAPVPINIDELLATTADKRKKYIQDRTDYKLTASMNTAVKASGSVEDFLAAVERRIVRSATPQPVSTGTMVLVPTDERRRSGSHYTPRSLTEPIVRTTLEPILKQLGEKPTPDQILSLKVCDPAMGSGAFLVEACRQLADELVASWAAHGYKPFIPPDEDELLHARRLIAQRCLYGVDKNPMAVDLAKLSLWLATLAKDHPFTFLDHTFRCGDSLVGLNKKQIASFHWDTSHRDVLQRAGLEDIEGKIIETRIKRANDHRKAILDAGDDMLPGMKLHKLREADVALDVIRMIGDACLSAFFSETKKTKRNQRCDELFHSLSAWFANSMSPSFAEPIDTAAASLQEGEHPITTFHWEIEFPEVFGRENGGFDAFVGNPPFAGRTTISEGSHPAYIDWLKAVHTKAHGNSDLVAHFFRRCFNLIRKQGCFGLIATKTIAQGDTRTTGLQWICLNLGEIYCAQRRRKWPGQAAVTVSTVFVTKGKAPNFRLDGEPVEEITAHLLTAGPHTDPHELIANKHKSFQGCVVVGMGFTFDDTDDSGLANTTEEMRQLVEKNRRNSHVIFPYIGGEEINDHPQHQYHRWVINFGDRKQEDAQKEWPDLMKIVEAKVKTEREERLAEKWSKDKEKRAKLWWQFARASSDLYRNIKKLERVLVCAQTSKHFNFVFLPSSWIFSHYTIVLAFESFAAFCAVQSRAHELWTRTFASTLEDRLRYIPTDCFANFAFPDDFEANEALELAGINYYTHRQQLLIENSEGLTKTYNRFHSPDERDEGILELRRLHGQMDEAVLRTYGWDDLAERATCEFLLEYEEEEDENGGSSRRRKPWRYRWPDDFRDEVLARLLELNTERAEEERRTGLAAEAEEKKKAKPKAKRTTKKRKSAKKKASPQNKELF